MLDQPLVSVIINCFNGENYLSQSLESVISQKYKNWEIIFWDNQSTDNSSKIFKSYKGVELIDKIIELNREFFIIKN